MPKTFITHAWDLQHGTNLNQRVIDAAVRQKGTHLYARVKVKGELF